MSGNIYINSDMSEGVLLHPTLPVTFIGETIVLPNTNFTGNELTVNFNTAMYYENPFFIPTGGHYSFYVHITGSGNSFQAHFERAYYYLQTYRYYSGDGKPIYNPGFSITIGGVNG